MTNFQKILTKIVSEDEDGQKGVAAKIGVEASYISMLIKDKRKLSKELAVVFGEVYGYDPNELLRVQGLEKLNLMSNDDLLSHLPEPKKLENGTKGEAMKALSKITSRKSNGKPKNFNEGELITDDQLVPQKVIEIPIKGFAGLKQAFFADDYIQENFRETTEFVRPEEKIIGVYYKTKVEKNNFSMIPTLNPGETTWGEPISEMYWNTENIFKADKVYSLWHPYRGILFKRITKHDVNKGTIVLSSDNEDKVTYEDEEFSLSEFRKILVIRKKEVLM